ncbi:hypothetical protein E2562_015501 [Oryza meyeriana var. granulata]|uniref:Bifunctional inhibitor/plant lipid transfer protein/seed storage helical domain-containing protein n=1 Tax=Oryza meyeriana var. granulata TaxID=110450 RepID=A0A6G1CNT8_9ORYZ|nr:hypothetical protein E2562_015501 [Oryza meyeriana var. granulata]
MAPSSKLTALFFAFAVVAATLAPAAEARVQGFNHEAASEPAIAGEKAATGGGAQQQPTLPGLPGLPFPLFPFFTFPFSLPIPGSSGGGSPPSAGSGFPFQLPFPLPFPQPGSPGGSPPSSGSGFQFPFPLPFPLPIQHPSSPAAPPSAGSGFQFPFPLPFPLPLPHPSSPGGAPPSSGFSFPFPHPSAPGSQPSQPSPASPTTPATPPSPPQPKECMTPLMSMMPCAEYMTNITVTTPPATCCDGFRSLVKTAPICLCHGLNGDLNKFLPLPVDLMKMMMLPATCGAMLPLQTLSMCNSPAVPPLMPPSPPAAPAPAPANPPSP